MVAVGISGVFKYGSTFLGYLVAVVLAAGVLVGGGTALAASGGVNLLDPSFGSLATSRAVGGAIVAALGGLVALSGLFGLIYKLVADATAVGVATANAPPVDEPAAATDDAEESADAEGSDVEGTTDAIEPAGPGESSVDGVTAEASGREKSSVASADRSDSVPAADDEVDHPEPPATTRNEPGPLSSREDATRPPVTGSDTGDETAEVDSGVREPADQEEVDRPAGEPATADDWTQSEYATGTRPADVDDVAQGDEPKPDDDPMDANETAGDDAIENDADRSEWTPPDPAEFEQSGDAPDDERAAESNEAVRTWDDVRNESDGDGLEAERAGDGVADPAAGWEEATETTGVADGDASAGVAEDGADWEESVEQSEPEPTETEPAVANDGADDDDEDRTLADEGVTSVEVNGDDDPLGDRLAGDGN